MPRATGEHKSIYDPIHGIVDLDRLALALLAHPAFQRLWGIRQTGFAHLVFPGANHTRLEHSIGVFWVAKAISERIEMDAADRRAVRVGALLHDLGHGPFSHTLEPTMQEALGYGHERVSRGWITGDETIIPSEVDARSYPAIPALLERSRVDPKQVADLVDPPHGGERRRLLRSILHGPIDADRIDYLQRDAHYTGVAHGAIDSARLLATVRAHHGQLVFAEKGRSAVEGFLVGRALMYASVYYHKTVRAAELMAQSAVERLRGYPESSRALFGLTDGQLFVRLADAGGVSASLVSRLAVRRLHKRVHGWRSLSASQRRFFLSLRQDPSARRAEEGRLAERLGGAPGSVLLDLAGLEARDRGGLDWSEVGILDDGVVTHPFRRAGPWQVFTDRPPTLWAVSVYVEPELRRRAGAWFARGRWPA